MHDEMFRRNLLDDPKSAIEEETGAKLPEGVEIRVVEETPDTIYLVLPPRAWTSQEGELSERELEAIAGGFGTPDVIPGGCRFDLTSGCTPPDTQRWCD